MEKIILIIGLSVIAQMAWAQNDSIKTPQKKVEGRTDSTRSGYTNNDPIGGPNSIGSLLLQDDEKKKTSYRVPVKYTKFWFDFKEKVYKKTGIEFEFAYTNLIMTAAKQINDSSQLFSGSGKMDMLIGARLIGRKDAKFTGTLYFNMSQRHSYVGDDRVTPMFFGFETGTSHMPGVSFRSYTFRFNELQFTQMFFNKRFGIAIGKVDPGNYFNSHALVSPNNQFMSLSMTISPSINWPDPGWGVVVGGYITPNIYAGFGLHDARGDLYRDKQPLWGGDDFWNGRFFTIAEIGYVTSFKERFERRISFTFSHTDEYTDGATDVVSKENYSYAFTAFWLFKNKYLPLIKFGINNGNGFNVVSKSAFMVGIGFMFKSHDIISVGISWDRPIEPSLRDQYIIETYYRINISPTIEITPDAQIIFKPALAQNVDVAAYFGIRTRITI